MSDGITWENPPRTRGRGGTDWGVVYEQLRRRPGSWAHVGTMSTRAAAASAAYLLAKGKYGGIPSGTVEAVSRSVDGEHRVYARYLGEAVSE